MKTQVPERILQNNFKILPLENLEWDVETMLKKPYTLDDFHIGESVVPLNQKELTLVIVEIDKKRGVIICRLSSEVEKMVHKFTPAELEKEFIVRPPNIVDVPKPRKKNNPQEMEEE